jgi:hypothetical protein
MSSAIAAPYPPHRTNAPRILHDPAVSFGFSSIPLSPLTNAPGSVHGMTTRKQKTAIALTGAVALASGAYALGSQAGDGTAGAAGGRDDPERPALIRGHLPDRAFGLDNLADRLGVEEDALEDALRDVRPDLPGPPKPPGDFAEMLADELGIEQSRVEDALERVRERTEKEFEDRRNEFAERLADRLNLDPDEVKDALDDGPPFGLVRPAHP